LSPVGGYQCSYSHIINSKYRQIHDEVAFLDGYFVMAMYIFVNAEAHIKV